MAGPLPRGLSRFATVATLAAVLLSPHVDAATSENAIPVPRPAKVPEHMPDDGAAVWLAMRVAEGPGNLNDPIRLPVGKGFQSPVNGDQRRDIHRGIGVIPGLGGIQHGGILSRRGNRHFSIQSGG
jgi:hypothetical protein